MAQLVSFISAASYCETFKGPQAPDDECLRAPGASHHGQRIQLNE